MTIVDRRKTGKNKSVSNRQKFIKRYKSKIKKSVDKLADKKGITDVLKDRKVVVNNDDIQEPNFNFDLATGERDVIFTGNKNLQKGDKIKQPPEAEEEGTSGSPDGEGFDEFTFTLTKEEFLDLYFADMKLPNFIKESLKGSTKTKWKRTGYSKDGIPARLDLVKTLKQSLARRIATKSKRFLDNVDMRYKHFTKQPYPIRQAVMICLMDVSGSMGEFEKGLAKKFFLLLYLFLNKCYTQVEVLFVSHTCDAEEVTEEEFFYGNKTGGTVVSSGLKLVNEIIDNRIELATTNVYVAQASDGDNWHSDDEVSVGLVHELLNKVQYMAYVQTENIQMRRYKDYHKVHDLLSLYRTIDNKRLQCGHILKDEDVYPVLRSLFEEE